MCSWPIQVNSVGTPPCALPFLFSSYCSDETQRKDTFLKEVGRQRGRNKTNQETRCEKQEGFICVAYLFFVVFVFRCFCCFGFSVHPFCCDLVCFFTRHQFRHQAPRQLRRWQRPISFQQPRLAVLHQNLLLHHLHHPRRTLLQPPYEK